MINTIITIKNMKTSTMVRNQLKRPTGQRGSTRKFSPSGFFKNPLVQLVILFLPVVVSAQLSFEVLLAEGTVKVQRSQKRTWEKVLIGQKINDNDLVETFFQTRLIMRFGGKNLIILGSNSKALVNIVQGEKAGTTNVNLTVFAGGAFVKAISDCHVNIYTANAVAEIDTGSISAIADSKSGETGFQLLGGTTFVRNIAQQNGRNLRAGLTTMILPSKEPTAPLYITHRHVAVLKHFFGDEYINSELDASGIKPTEDLSGRASFAKGLKIKDAEYKDEGIHRTLFSIDRIFGSIIKDRELSNDHYKPIEFSEHIFTNKAQLHFQSGFAFTSTGTKSRYLISVSQKLKFFDAGLRLNFAQNSVAALQAGFSSLPGILDKVDHLTIGNTVDSLFLSLGPINNYTLGYGLVVDQFSNVNRNIVYQPLGARVQVGLFGIMSLKAFTSDVTNPLVSGVYLSLEPSMYHFGAGYFFDVNHYKQTSDFTSFRFSKQTASEDPFKGAKNEYSNEHIYNVNFGTNIFTSDDKSLTLRMEFAQKLFNGDDGFVVRLPYLNATSDKFSFGGGLVMQQGRLLSGIFNKHYTENRIHLKNGETTFDSDTLITVMTQLSKKRRASGFAMYLSTNPYRGIDLRFDWQQDFANKHSLKQPVDTTDGQHATGDFSLKFSARMNDTLFKYIKFAEIYVAQNHGTTIPAGSGFFRSWDFEAGFFVLSSPLLSNMAFELGGSMFYFDMGSKLNNTVEPTDFIFELSAGVRWGFL